MRMTENKLQSFSEDDDMWLSTSLDTVIPQELSLPHIPACREQGSILADLINVEF